MGLAGGRFWDEFPTYQSNPLNQSKYPITHHPTTKKILYPIPKILIFSNPKSIKIPQSNIPKKTLPKSQTNLKSQIQTQTQTQI